MCPEAESQDNPELRGDQGERPKWVIQTRSRFTEQSLGLVLFPPELEGRSRPEPVLNKDLDPSVLFPKSPHSKVLKKLVDQNVKTVADILGLPKSQLSSFTAYAQTKIIEGLSNYLQGLLVTPHGRLIQAMYKEPQYPVPVEREQEMMDAVEEKINALKSERDREFLIYCFGLYDGIGKSYRETNKKYNLFYNVIAAIQDGALKSVHGLREYRSLPQESFGRQVFGAVFQKDLPQNLRRMRIDLSHLSDSTKEELPRINYLLGYGSISPSFYVVNIGDIWGIDLQKADVSQGARQEISQHLRNFVAEEKTK